MHSGGAFNIRVLMQIGVLPSSEIVCKAPVLVSAELNLYHTMTSGCCCVRVAASKHVQDQLDGIHRWAEHGYDANQPTSCAVHLDPEIYKSLQDDMAHKEEVKAKQRALNKQAATRKVLEDQLVGIQMEKDAAKEQKKREALELKKSIRQYEEEGMQRWQQHKEQQAKTKQMYSQQVYLCILSHFMQFNSRHAFAVMNTTCCLMQCVRRTLLRPALLCMLPAVRLSTARLSTVLRLSTVRLLTARLSTTLWLFTGRLSTARLSSIVWRSTLRLSTANKDSAVNNLTTDC